MIFFIYSIMKHLKEFKLYEKKKYTHGLYTKKSYESVLDKQWTDIRVSKNPRTIYFDVVDDKDDDGKDTEYTYEVYFSKYGDIKDIHLQEPEVFIKKLREEITTGINLDDFDIDLICVPEIKQARAMKEINL